MGERCDNKSKIEVADAYRSLSVICGSFTQKVNYSFCLAVFTCDCFYSILIFTRLLLNPKSKCRCMMWKGIFTARNRSCGNVMFLQVSVYPQAGGGVSQHAMGRSLCDQGVVTRGCVTDGACDQGVYTPGLTPPNTVNKRAVCTLLECFLV